MTSISGTRTEANLTAAFTGESRAHASYIRFAAKAKDDGHDSIAYYFDTTALNEQEHAKIWLKFLGGTGKEAINAGQINVGSSKDNLQAAINGETYENSEMYPSFAKTAREEGFEAIARLFDQVSDIEKSHAQYFKVLLDKLNSASPAATSASQGKWKCCKCGFLAAEKDAPASCPVCNSNTFKLF